MTNHSPPKYNLDQIPSEVDEVAKIFLDFINYLNDTGQWQNYYCRVMRQKAKNESTEEQI